VEYPMGRRRRKSTSEELFDVLYDLTNIFWQVGAIVGAVLVLATFWIFDWAVDQYIRASTSPMLGLVTQHYGWVYFLLPMMTAFLAIIFGVKSYQAFTREHRYLK